MDSYKTDAHETIQDENHNSFDEIIQRMMEFHVNILNSISQEDFESYFAYMIDLNTLLKDFPKLESEFLIKIFCPDFGKAIFESILFYHSHPECVNYIPSNLNFLSTILNFNDCFSFYSQSPLVEETMRILCSSVDILKKRDFLKSEKEIEYHIEIVEECLHILYKTVAFYKSFEEVPPYDLNFLLNPQGLLSETFQLSSRCEECTVEFVKQIVKFLDFTPNSRDICDLFYFIFKQVQSKTTIRSMMITMTLLIECDSNKFLELFIQRKVIQTFMQYIVNCGKELFNEVNVANVLIPCLKFTQKAIFLHNYYSKQTSILLKIISINFFDYLYSNSSKKLAHQSISPDQEIMYLEILKIIIDIFIIRINQNPDNDELNKIVILFSKIIQNFSKVDFAYKGKIVIFIDAFLSKHKDDVYPILIKEDSFGDDIPDFVFNSDDANNVIRYLKIFNIMFDFALENDEIGVDHLHSIYENINDSLCMLIGDVDTDQTIKETAQYTKNRFQEDESNPD